MYFCNDGVADTATSTPQSNQEGYYIAIRVNQVWLMGLFKQAHTL